MLDDLTKARIARRQRARTKDLAWEVRNGIFIEPPVDAHASFFPPRPVIKKDRKEMARVYGDEGKAD